MKFIITLLLFTSIAQADDALKLLESGNVQGARNILLSELENNQSSWNSYMRIAWLEDTVSEHRKAIEYSNKALEIANKEKDSFKIGRSLCWLGWAYSRLGLYELALQFLENAVEIGAPNGEVQIPMVWGLATQEIGAIYFRQGDTKGAIDKLLSTYKLASELGVSTGIAEGGVYLAEIYLATGNLGEAESYIGAALKNIEAACPDIRGKIYVTATKIWQKKSELMPEHKAKTENLIKTTIDYCSKKNLPICHAEALLLKSQSIPYNHFTNRHNLVTDAFEILANKESELRGLAEAELGRVYLENDRVALAKFYIFNGVKVNKELFRKVDNAFLSKQLANLAEKNGEAEKQKNKLIESLDAALLSNLLPQALEVQKDLAKLHEKQGFYTAALQWNKDAQGTIKKIIEQNPAQEENKEFQIEMLKLEENAIFLATFVNRERRDS